MDYGLSHIEVAGGWSLDDFLVLLRRYRQLYAFTYALGVKPLDPSLRERQAGDRWERKRRAPFHQYPWKGGFSTINFFGSLETQVPKEERMRIKRIHIASPGWVELVGNMVPMVGVAVAVASVAVNAIQLRKALRDVRSTLKELDLHKKNLQTEEALVLKKDDAERVEEVTTEIETAMKLTPKQMENLDTRTSKRKLTKAKILVGAGKRALEIADLQDVDKIDLQEPRKLTDEEIASVEKEIAEDAKRKSKASDIASERDRAAYAKEEEEEDEDDEDTDTKPKRK